MFFILFISLLVVVIIVLCFNKNEDYWKKRNVVQVDGVLYKFIRTEKSLPEVHKEIYDQYPSEPYVGLIVGSIPILLLKDLENIRTVLTSDFLSFPGRGFPTGQNAILADSLLFVDQYERWRIVRKRMSPIFTTHKLKSMFLLIEECADNFVKTVKKNTNIVGNVYEYTTACLTGSVFGLEAQKNELLVKKLFKMSWDSTVPSLKSNIKFAFASVVPNLFIWLNMTIFGESFDFFLKYVQSMLKIRRENPVKKNDFLGTCLGFQDAGVLTDDVTGYSMKPTDELIAGQAVFFYLAGVDTSATALHFVLIELAHNQQILKKVTDEIEAFVKNDSKVSFEILENMKYLDKVLDESVRKYPPVGFLQRRCTKETVLPVGNLKIEKDMVLLIPIFAVQRDKTYYPDPEKFDPERFAAEDAKDNIAFLAYGKGNRSCLGGRYARVQIKTALIGLLRNYDLELREKPPKTFEPSFFGIKATKRTFYVLTSKISGIK